MLSEFILDIIYDIVSWLLGLLPEISFSADSTAFQYFIGIIRVSAYMLPMGAVSKIISLVFVLTLFRLVIAVIKAVWDLLPFA